jgi:diacylglycerol O-acyltransferase / wax synthase
MRRLNSVDAMWLFGDDGRQHMHVSMLTVFEATAADGTVVDLPAVRRILEQRIHLMPIFRQRLKWVPLNLDYPFFVEDPDFDIDSHLWEMALPAPGNDHQLGEQVSRLASRPLDQARPLWELYVIHGLENNRTAMLAKVHHAAVDAMSGIELLGTLLDPTPEIREFAPPEDVAPPEPEPSDLQLAAMGIADLPRQAGRAARALPRTLRQLDQSPTMRHLPGTGTLSRAADQVYQALTGDKDGEIPASPAGKAPRISMGGPLSAHRRFGFTTLDLNTVKAIRRNVPGTTINDIVVALSAGALRRRLQARGDLPADPLIAGVPISVRSSAEGAEGNHISMMYIQLPTNEPDILARINRSHEVMEAVKILHHAVPAPLMQESSYTTPPAALGGAVGLMAILGSNEWVDPPHNVTISNIPGSRSPLYLAGAKVLARYPVNVLLDGLAASVTLLSYQDAMDLGITVERDHVPDIWDLVDDFVAELDAMAQATAESSEE